MATTNGEWECVACGEKTGREAERPCRCQREAEAAKAAAIREARRHEAGVRAFLTLTNAGGR